MSIISIIPARGGSKGVPRKNLHILNGKPLLYYSVTASKKSRLIDKTYVSSDDAEILEYAQSLGVDIIKRPPNLATDTTPSELSLLHLAAHVEFKHLVFLQATAPLVTPDLIDSAIDSYMGGHYDSLVSVYKDYGFWWEKDRPLYDPKNRKMRQDMRKNLKFIESGMFYITSRKALLESKCRISGKCHTFVHDKAVGYDINDLDDFSIVEFMMEKNSE